MFIVLLAGFQPLSFGSRVRRSANEASPSPLINCSTQYSTADAGYTHGGWAHRQRVSTIFLTRRRVGLGRCIAASHPWQICHCMLAVSTSSQYKGGGSVWDVVLQLIPPRYVTLSCPLALPRKQRRRVGLGTLSCNPAPDRSVTVSWPLAQLSIHEGHTKGGGSVWGVVVQLSPGRSVI